MTKPVDANATDQVEEVEQHASRMLPQVTSKEFTICKTSAVYFLI